MMDTHEDPEIQSTITKLMDLLCEHERNTGKRSVLIIREQGGFVCRAQDGKPFSEEFMPTDLELMKFTFGDDF